MAELISVESDSTEIERRPGPLCGVRVIEFGHVAAGPYGSMLLADLGADVIKVESPSGDQLRNWPPVERDDTGAGFSYNFGSLNRNKRSVLADLNSKGDRIAVSSLVAGADVVIENFRPGVLAKFDLDYSTVSEGHRGLVYCSISGFGTNSDQSRRGAFDVVIQAMSGLMSVTGEPDGPPTKCGVPVGDFVAGLYAALSIVALLPRVKETGESVYVDCPMFDCLVATAALQTSEYWGTGQPPVPMGSAHPRNAPYQAFRACDGYFTVAAGNDRLWEAVCHAVDMDALLEDERFVDQASRVAHQVELAQILQQRFEKEPISHWMEKFATWGVPSGPVQNFKEVLESPHVQNSGLVQPVDLPVIGRTNMIGFPVHFSDWEPAYRLAPPLMGQHTDEVLHLADGRMSQQ